MNFDVTTSVSGWMVSAYALGFALFALVAGPLSDGLRPARRAADRLRRLRRVHRAVRRRAGLLDHDPLPGAGRRVGAALVTPQIWASIPVLVTRQRDREDHGLRRSGHVHLAGRGRPHRRLARGRSWHVPFCAVAWTLRRGLARPVRDLPVGRGPHRHLRERTGILHHLRRTVLGPGPSRYLVGYLAYQTGVFETISFIGSWLARDFGLGVSAIGAAMMALGVGMATTSLFGSHIIKRLGEARTLAYAFAGAHRRSTARRRSPRTSPPRSCCSRSAPRSSASTTPSSWPCLLSQTTAARGTVSSLATTALYVGTTIGGFGRRHPAHQVRRIPRRLRVHGDRPGPGRRRLHRVRSLQDPGGRARRGLTTPRGRPPARAAPPSRRAAGHGRLRGAGRPGRPGRPAVRTVPTPADHRGSS